MITRLILIAILFLSVSAFAQSQSESFEKLSAFQEPFLFEQNFGEEDPSESKNFLGKNLHEIYAGEYYRSAQLSKSQLEDTIVKYGIKTVINLRGEHLGEVWYDDEVSVTKSYGVELINIGMSAKRLPHRKDLIKLLDAFDTAPRPLLVHCQAGADRTGEASAIYLMEFKGKSKNEALKMLTVKYHHLSFATPAKRYFIESVYQDAGWARSSYDPCTANYKYYDKAKFCTN